MDSAQLIRLFSLIVFWLPVIAQKNVLMIVIDDLHPTIRGALNPEKNKHMVTPNLHACKFFACTPQRICPVCGMFSIKGFYFYGQENWYNENLRSYLLLQKYWMFKMCHGLARCVINKTPPTFTFPKYFMFLHSICLLTSQCPNFLAAFPSFCNSMFILTWALCFMHILTQCSLFFVCFDVNLSLLTIFSLDTRCI